MEDVEKVVVGVVGGVEELEIGKRVVVEGDEERGNEVVI